MTGVDTVLGTSPVVWTLETILCTVIRVLFEKTEKMIFNNIIVVHTSAPI